MPHFLDKKDFIRRHIIILVMALFFGVLGLFDENSPEFMNGNFLRGVLWTFLFVACIWDGNLALIEYGGLNRWSWETEVRKKIIFATAIGILWPAIVHYVFNILLYPIILGKACNLSSKQNILTLVMSVSITLMINSIMVAMEFFSHWRKSLVEKEALKRSTITAEFESLKNQVNPHFLFNSLNSLIGLIEEEPKVAVKFVQELAGVYRYLLSQSDKETSTLGEELDFMKSYAFLNQIRFGENLKVEVNVPENLLHKNIITLTLQILLENAIKHNIISKEKPLTIQIYVAADCLCVRNNLQAKTILSPSNGIGLKNIESRYHFFSDKLVSINSSGEYFEVCVPLID